MGAAMVYAPRGPHRGAWQALGVGLVALAVLAALVAAMVTLG